MQLKAGCLHWYNLWDNLTTLFDYPPAIRKVIYTTNAIKSLNSVIRKATKRRKLFPSDDAALKVAFLAIHKASKKWTMPIRDWKPALNRFIIEFGDRMNGHLQWGGQLHRIIYKLIADDLLKTLLNEYWGYGCCNHCDFLDPCPRGPTFF